jgi:hypothetical protein
MESPGDSSKVSVVEVDLCEEIPSADTSPINEQMLNREAEAELDAEYSIDSKDIPPREEAVSETYLRWICSLVSHFAAAQVVTTYVRTLNPDIRHEYPIVISLLAVKNKPLPVEPWRKTIRNVFTHHNNALKDAAGNVESIIQLLESYTKEIGRGPGPAYIYQPLREEVMPFTGSVHCKAAIASLAKYANEAIADSEEEEHIRQLIEVRLQRLTL